MKLPENMEEYEKEVIPKFDNYEIKRHNIKFDVYEIEKPINSKFYILQFMYKAFDFIRIRMYKLKFKCFNCNNFYINTYVLNKSNMESFSFQDLIFKNNTITRYYESDIDKIFYYKNIPILKTINNKDSIIFLNIKDNKFYYSIDGYEWKLLNEKLFDEYKKMINKTEIMKHYDTFKCLFKSFDKNDKKIYLIGILNTVIFCDKTAYDYIMKTQELWIL